MSISQRKNDHIEINLQKDVNSGITTGLERFHFVHQALPEIDIKEIDTGVDFLGKKLSIPLMISSMTGGTDTAAIVNEILARTAAKFGMAMGLGSIRIALENHEHLNSFQVRKFAPDILLLSNLGAVQLNYGYTLEHCKLAIDLVEADGLILHLNCLQEALQQDGNTNFSGLLKKIESVCHGLTQPVIIKEIGWGISSHVAAQLIDAGVAAIDVAGAGGTSWSEVEKYRAGNIILSETAAVFKGWGIPLVKSLQAVRKVDQKIPIIASGGIKTGVDIAKCISLGGNLCGIAGQFLKAAASSIEDTFILTETLKKQLEITMFASGAKSCGDLSMSKLSEE
jgi:isopentenyl-diphosphate delta-isomerase